MTTKTTIATNNAGTSPAPREAHQRAGFDKLATIKSLLSVAINLAVLNTIESRNIMRINLAPALALAGARSFTIQNLLTVSIQRARRLSAISGEQMTCGRKPSAGVVIESRRGQELASQYLRAYYATSQKLAGLPFAIPLAMLTIWLQESTMALDRAMVLIEAMNRTGWAGIECEGSFAYWTPCCQCGEMHLSAKLPGRGRAICTKCDVDYQLRCARLAGRAGRKPRLILIERNEK